VSRFRVDPSVLLAQQVDLTRHFVVLGLLILFVVGATFVVIAVRRRLLGGSGSGADGSGGIFGQLREMRDRGEISPEEFEAIRKTMIERMRRGEAPELPGGMGGDPGKDRL